jgi:hypothetical protein
MAADMSARDYCGVALSFGEGVALFTANGDEALNTPDLALTQRCAW